MDPITMLMQMLLMKQGKRPDYTMNRYDIPQYTQDNMAKNFAAQGSMGGPQGALTNAAMQRTGIRPDPDAMWLAGGGSPSYNPIQQILNAISGDPQYNNYGQQVAPSKRKKETVRAAGVK